MQLFFFKLFIMKKMLAHLAGVVAAILGIVYLTSFLARPHSAVEDLRTREQIGEKLFFDPILSGDGSLSCASCHRPQFAFADTVTFSDGVAHNKTGRNTPTVMYLNTNHVFFWDGRAHSFQEQASGPISNVKEMNLAIPIAITRLNENAGYLTAFQRVYGRKPDSTTMLDALAAYETSLGHYESPYDRFLKGNDTAMSDAAVRGFRIFFREKACGNSACHHGINFNSDSLVNIGVHNPGDRGLYELTRNETDIGRFKTPTLRNVTVTYPYMHNGIHKTLQEVVDYYNDPKNFPVNGTTHPDVKDPRGKMNPKQVQDLIEFLKALTDDRFRSVAK